MAAVKFKMRERDIVLSCLFKPHYSGEESERVWSSVRDPSNDSTLYLLACALQDVEARFLQALNPGVARRARLMVRQHRKKHRDRRRNVAR